MRNNTLLYMGVRPLHFKACIAELGLSSLAGSAVAPLWLRLMMRLLNYATNTSGIFTNDGKPSTWCYCN